MAKNRTSPKKSSGDRTPSSSERIQQRSSSPWPLTLLLVLLQSSHAQDVTYNTPWPQCSLPPSVLQERTGAVTEKVLSMCLTTYSGPKVTFTNADRFYVGTSASVADINTMCYRISQIVTVQEFNGTRTFIPGGSVPPQAVDQAWDLSLWPKFNPNKKQTINLTVSNFGPTPLQFSGIDFASLGLPQDRVFGKGEVTAFQVEYSKVKLTYESLPILQEYLVKTKPSSPGVVTAIVMMKDLPPTPGAVNQLVSYALVVYNPGNPQSEWDFFLYETTVSVIYSTRAGAGGRRLLVATAKNKAPPTACARACCKPASPLPKNCAKGSPTYPNCMKMCSCACR